MKKSVKHHKDHDKISASKHEEQGFYSSPSREHLTHPVQILTIKSLQAACFFFCLHDVDKVQFFAFDVPHVLRLFCASTQLQGVLAVLGTFEARI